MVAYRHYQEKIENTTQHSRTLVSTITKSDYKYPLVNLTVHRMHELVASETE